MILNWRPLCEALGAEVLDLDLRQPLQPELAEAVRQLWYRRLVLLFRRQELSVEDQERVARLFGELQAVRSRPSYAHEHVMYVSNVPVDGKEGVLPVGEMHFHSDQCYYETPARATALYAIEVPPEGGNTLFASARAACAALPPDLRQRIEGLEALHVYDYESSPTVRRGEVSATAPHFVHPVVVRLPEAGEPSLFVNRLMTDHVVGLPADESRSLLEALWAHLEQPRFVYEHAWQPGDLVVWDNLATLHARRDFDPAQKRVLRRIAVQGTRPAAAARTRG